MKKIILFVFLLLPTVIVISLLIKNKSTENRSQASGGEASNICGLPSSEDSTLGSFSKERSFNVSLLLSECYSENLSPDEKTKCLNIIKTNLNGMTLSYQNSWRAMEPIRGIYNWNSLDNVMNFARQNNLKIHFFHLIWTNHERYAFPPGWVFPNITETNCGTRTKAELEEIMKNHIQGIISHGGDIVTTWNVVNEAFSNDGTQLQDCFYKIIGADYIDKAFLYAREAAPNATLVLNEYFPNGSPFRPKVNGFFAYVKAAKARGIPIDAVGIQNHQLKVGDYAFSPKYLDDLTYFFQKARETNVKVYITEMDVYQGQHTQEQLAKVYKDTLALCLKNTNCVSFGVFGVSDKYNWSRTPNHANLSDSKPVLFDESFQKKLAYYAVMDAIRENTTRTCASGLRPSPTSSPDISPKPTIGPRCYTNKDKTSCENDCGEKTGASLSFKCRWLGDQQKCVETPNPCK